MKRDVPPNPFDEPPESPLPALWEGNEHMTGWWSGYQKGLIAGRWRAEVDQMTRWQRWRYIRSATRRVRKHYGRS